MTLRYALGRLLLLIFSERIRTVREMLGKGGTEGVTRNCSRWFDKGCVYDSGGIFFPIVPYTWFCT